MASCFCDEDLNYAGECWRGSISGGHHGNCIGCGENAILDEQCCCSAECDQVSDYEFVARLVADPQFAAELEAEGLH